MKKFTGIFIFLLLINISVPFLYSKFYASFSVPTKEEISKENIVVDDSVTLYDESAGKEIKVSLKDYLIGATACEMPATYEENALKAQMIAVHSYYLYCKDNPGYLEKEMISVNSSKLKGFTDKTTLNGFWGTSYYDYYSKFERCYNEVKDIIVKYENKPALTTYYAVSCGKTQTSENQWGENIPYLISVDSNHDAVSENFLKLKELSESEMFSILKSNYPSIHLNEEEPENWFGDIIYFDTGYAKFVTVGGDLVPADQFRNMLNLPSTCFMIFREDGKFSIATKGYGHGVGLSQFGANQLSQQGKDYRQILSHYYPGTSIENI